MKRLKLLVWVCLALVCFRQPAAAQEATIRKPATPNATRSDRELDGLNGPVRRVRVETAKIVVKEGKPIEDARVVRVTTTYDAHGRKIDTLARPVEGSAPSGKEQYRYDAKGNITEMVVRGTDGSILSKEIYQYEFDELGNWKKMTTSVATYEDGKLSFEPVEVTYRTITYYYSQAINNISTASASKPGSVSESASPGPPKSVPSSQTTSQTVESANARESKTGINDSTTVTPVATDGNTSGNKNAVATAVLPAPQESPSTKKDSTKTPETPSASAETPYASSSKIPVTHFTEAALRSAAINLPQPELNSAAELVGRKGRVEVQVIIDEKGEVTSARGTSGNPLLNQAAEAAALKARFSPAKLSPDPARGFGVITYDFATPSAEIPADPLPAGSADESRKATASSGRASQPKPDAVASSDTNSAALSVGPNVTASEDVSQFYKQGLSHLKAGRYTEAVDALRQAVYRNPEDALAYAKLGLAYSALRQYNETVTVLKLAIRIKPEVIDAEAYYRLGEAYTSLGKHKEALGAFKQAMYIARAQVIESDPSKYTGFPPMSHLHYSLGLAYQNLGGFKEAIKEFTQAINLMPDFAEAHYGIALAQIGLEDRKAAEKEEKILRRLNPALADKVAVAINTSPGFFPQRRP